MQCNDPKCPHHGKIKVRGMILRGIVVSTKPQKTAVVAREFLIKIPKYERYKKVRSKLYAHNPSCINAKEGDIVEIGETRRLSKTKSFVVLRVIGHREEIPEAVAEELLTEKKEEEKPSEKEKPEEETAKKKVKEGAKDEGN